MSNDNIVNILCKIEKINLNNYYPIVPDYYFYHEIGIKRNVRFDINHPIDRMYEFKMNNFCKQVRFVLYKGMTTTTVDYVTIYIYSFKISMIKFNEIEGRYVYHKQKEIHIPLKEIERIFKLNQIVTKMRG